MPEGIAITLPPCENGESIRDQSHSREKSESRKPSPGMSAYRHVGLAGLYDSVTMASDAATFRFGCGSVRRPPEPST